MVRVVASSRLHFGLIALPGGTGRTFGGAGLMVNAPGIEVCVEPAARWSAIGPVAERALDYARRLAPSLPSAQAFAIEVVRSAPEHVGLGVGTQLALAVGHAVGHAAGHQLDPVDLARLLGRGQRSGIGVHGFAHGGFLVDGGKGASTTVAPLLFRAAFPNAWKILLLIPQRQGLSGMAEKEAFVQASSGRGVDHADALSRLLLLGILPGLVEQDLQAFGAALHEYNRKVGEMFTPWQGGVYATPQADALVDWLGKRGISAGQSSWGPTVYGIAEAERLQAALRDLDGFEAAAGITRLLTSGCNEPARARSPVDAI